MNQGDMLAALTLHGRKNRRDALEQRQQANTAISQADAYANEHLGDDMKEKRSQIRGEGQRQAQVHLDAAQVHDDRAACAEGGYLLHRNGVEARDPHYAIEHQGLIACAGEHGVLTQEPM